MAVVRMVQVAVDEIVDMIAMRNCFVSAVWTVHMTGSVSRAAMIRRAGGGIRRADFQLAFIEVAFVRRMQVAIVQVVDVTIVLNRSMAAACAVDMIVIFVDMVTHQSSSPSIRACGGVSLAWAKALNTRSTMC